MAVCAFECARHHNVNQLSEVDLTRNGLHQPDDSSKIQLIGLRFPQGVLHLGL
jgi:hypothetical protein